MGCPAWKVGFDSMAGVAHADNQYRDSFVYEVMEPIRPDVDAWLLEFLQTHIFSAKDFHEKKDGGIRLTLRITPILAETVSLWSEKTELVIEQVEGVLLRSQNPEYKIHRKRKTRT
jgi:CRISPR/Cas system-associated endonuclease Cas1